MRLAELFPGRLLVIVEVFQVVKLVGQIEQVVLQRVEPLDELAALLVGQQRVDERQAVGDLVPAGVVAGVGQLLVAVERRLPALELGLQEGEQAVLAVRPHLGEQVFAQAAGVLDRLGVGSLPLADDDLAALRRGRDRLVHLVDGQQGGVHHQVDLAQDDEPGQQQQHFVVRPAVGPQGVPLLQHVVQDDLLALHRAELQVAAEVFEGLGIVLAGLEQQLSPWRCRCCAGRPGLP